MPACARKGDPHACPREGHGTTPIVEGAPHTFFDGQPAACVGHKTDCGATIVVGFPKFTVNGLPVAHVGSRTSHDGVLMGGSPDIFAASMGGKPIDFQKMGAIDEDGELDRAVMDELLADPALEEKALKMGAIVEVETQSFHFLDPLMSIFHRTAAEIPLLTTTMAKVSGLLKNEGDKLLDAEQPEEGPPTKEEQDEDQLIVQVVGKEHNNDQQIAIYDICGTRLGKTEERTKEPFSYKNSKSQSEGIENELHIWPWPKNEPRRELKLEVEAVEGGPIVLPLMDNAIATYRRTARQCNVICPVVPASFVENARSPHPRGNSTLAKTRPGFLYIYNKGRLWRELEIRQEDQEGKLTTYHDVRLLDYRLGKDPDNAFDECIEKRKVVGKGLKDIWLPVHWNQRRQKIEILYSEVPLPATRLNRFERDPKLRKRRSKNLNLNIVEVRVDQDMYQQDIILGNCMPRVRPRAPAAEFELDFPAAYLLSLGGNYTSDQYTKAVHYLDSMSNVGNYRDHYQSKSIGQQSLSEQIRNLRWDHQSAPHLESNALSALYWKHIKNVDQQEQAKRQATLAFWEANHPAIQQEAFDDARTRKIGVIIADDPLFRARHLRQRAAAANELLNNITRISQQQDHYHSALLIDRYLAPKNIGGERNPFYTDFKDFWMPGKQKIGKTLYKTERQQALKYFIETQQALGRWLKDHDNQHALGDLFCLSGADYLGAFKFTVELINWAAMPSDVISAQDSALTKQRRVNTLSWVYSLATKTSEPLHAMLYPPTTENALAKPYCVPESDDDQGDGHFRGAEMAKLELKENMESPGLTLDGLWVQSAVSQNSFIIPWFKNLNAYLMYLSDTLSNLVTESIEVTQGHKVAYREARIEVNKRILELRNERTKAEFQEAEKSVHQATIDAQEKIKFHMDLHSPDINRLRAWLPKSFGELTFERRNKAELKEFYVLGEVKEFSPEVKKFHGELLLKVENKTNELIGSSNKTIFSAGTVLEPKEKIGVFGIPINEETSEALAGVTKANTELTVLNKSIEMYEKQINDGFGDTRKLAAQLNEARQVRERLLNSKSLQFTQSPYFAGLILQIELWNLFSGEIGNAQSNISNKGAIRTMIGVTGAIIDTTIALEMYTTRLLGATAMTKAFEIGFTVTEQQWKAFLPKFLEKLSANLIGRITVGVVLGAAASVILAGVHLYDACYEWNRGNYGAAIGYGIVGISALVGLAGVFFAGSIAPAGAGIVAITIAAMSNPFTCIALIGFVIGYSVIQFFDNTPIEEWLVNGPFGRKAESNLQDPDKKHLLDPQETFYRLFILLVQPRMEIGPNPYKGQAQGKLGEANARVRIFNPLSGLSSSQENETRLNTHIKFQYCKADEPYYSYRLGHYVGNNCRTHGDPTLMKIFHVDYHSDMTDYFVQTESFCIGRACQRVRIERENRFANIRVWAQAYYIDPFGKERFSPGPAPLDPMQTLSIDEIDNIINDQTQVYWARESSHARIISITEHQQSQQSTTLEPA